LLPFSLLYGLIIIIRNYLFDQNFLKAGTFNLPLICIGNLSVGGTGKSPMVEYLLHMFRGKYRVATISRGYKRKTKGYALANDTTTALEIGDEPMQFYLKFPEVAVAVGEERMEAVPQLLHDKPGTEVIILDDAFQHRWIKAGLNIVLTEYSNLFTRDFFLPTGDLRDQRRSYRRAQVIFVTKCPAEFTEADHEKIVKEINPVKGQHIFFTAMAYGIPYHITNHVQRKIQATDEVLLVCGIANPLPLKNYIMQNAKTYYDHMYPDHHIFTIDDLNDINSKFIQMQAEEKVIVTTEKDAVRLIKFDKQISDMPLYVLPVKHHILFNQGQQFQNVVLSFINTFTGRN